MYWNMFSIIFGNCFYWFKHPFFQQSWVWLRWYNKLLFFWLVLDTQPGAPYYKQFLFDFFFIFCLKNLKSKNIFRRLFFSMESFSGYINIIHFIYLFIYLWKNVVEVMTPIDSGTTEWCRTITYSYTWKYIKITKGPKTSNQAWYQDSQGSLSKFAHIEYAVNLKITIKYVFTCLINFPVKPYFPLFDETCGSKVNSVSLRFTFWMTVNDLVHFNSWQVWQHTQPYPIGNCYNLNTPLLAASASINMS